MPFPSPHTPATAHGIAVENLGCERGGRTLFRRLNLRLEAGGALAITGPNGAGKTSLLRILAGLLRPGTGSISITPADDSRSLAQLSRLVGARDALKPGLTPRETLAFHGHVFWAGDAPQHEVASALADFGLSAMADMPNGWLSSGQRRRVALASLALCGHLRPLWLLDEPLNALDGQGCRQLAACVDGHRARGGMVIAATHQPLGWPGLDELTLGDA
jgi:heme exporter protein A